MIEYLIFIIIYHIIIHNNLEKMFLSAFFNYDDIKRPLNKCNNNFLEPLSCYGMPSGHAELITILASLLYKNNIISLEIAILLIIIISSQRVISNMHTVKQVCAGIILGLIYGKIYNSSKYSYIIIIVFGLLMANFTIMKLDSKMKTDKIPDWVSKEMYLSIEKKKNISQTFKIWHVYSNCSVHYPLFISWKKLEIIMDQIINNIKQFEITNSIKFDAIVGIKTGGAILSDYISTKLNIKNYKIRLKVDCNIITNNDISTYINNQFVLGNKKTICENINDNLNNFNIILIDETIQTSTTMNQIFKYLIEIKKVKYVYQQTIFLNNHDPENQYNYIYKYNTPFLWPWGYDN